MRVLILGGTGFIGRRIVAALAGHEITLFNRGTTQLQHSAYGHIIGDRRRLGDFRAEFRAIRPDVVLDMNAQNEADAKGTLEAVAEVAGRLVMISSLSVYRSFGVFLGIEQGAADNRPQAEDALLRSRLFPYRGERRRHENDPKRWLDDYDKIPAEAAFLLRGAPGCSIVRLPLVYGADDPDRRVAAYADRMTAGMPICLTESVARWRNARAHVDNAAHAIALVVTRGAPGRIYNLAEPHDWTEAEWIGRIGAAAGWTGQLEIIPDGTGEGRPMIAEFPDGVNFQQHLRADSGRIRRELGYREAIAPDCALLSSISEATRCRAQASTQCA